MKYVRSQNGVYSIPDSDEIGYDIEGLCDEFVCDRKIINYDYKSQTITYGNGALDFRELDMNDIQKGIYGAIWTDKGLIYVAKMNEKGELELL